MIIALFLIVMLGAIVFIAFGIVGTLNNTLDDMNDRDRNAAKRRDFDRQPEYNEYGVHKSDPTKDR